MSRSEKAGPSPSRTEAVIEHLEAARRRTPEGTRFDLAHELGHLLLHSFDVPHNGAREEGEAGQFAADFLIPPGTVLAHLRLHASLGDILRLKTSLKVPAMAMLRAAYHHGKLSVRGYHSQSPPAYRSAPAARTPPAPPAPAM